MNLPEIIEIDGYRFQVADEYQAIVPIVEVFVFREPFATREEAEAARAEVEEILGGMGRWEDLISTLRHVREGVEDQAYSTDIPAIHREDIETDILEGREGPKLVLDIADTSERNLYENPRLRDAPTWGRSLKNLVRWRALQGVLGFFR